LGGISSIQVAVKAKINRWKREPWARYASTAGLFKTMRCLRTLWVKNRPVIEVILNLPNTCREREGKKNPAFKMLLGVLLILCGGLLPDVSLAQQGFKLGRAEVHPGVSVEAKYDDNVFLDADKRFQNGTFEVAQEDYIFTFSPTLTIEQKRLKGDNFGFRFRYLGEDEHFADLTDQDNFNHDVSALVEFGDVEGDVTWTLGGRYLDNRYPISTEFASNLNPRQDRTTYDFKSNLKWLVASHVEADIKAKFSRNLFDDFDFENQEFDQYDGSGTLLWHTTALTSVGINYSYRFMDYLKSSAINFDSATNSGSFIFKWKPLSVFTSELWLGINHIEFEQVANQDRDDLIYQVKLNYKPKSSQSWELFGLREIANSYFQDIQVFQKTAVGLTWNQRLGVKWTGKAGIDFQLNRYDIAAIDQAGGGALKFRKDKRFSALLSISYDIQGWMKVLLEYNYRHNDSNFDNFDYKNNIASIQFSLLY
jgi:hypothetical protein